MRNLTILRKKRFVGCLGTMKVYIEDALAQDLVIQGVPCRKLGTLKNGEQKTFSVEDTAARIYVIADKLSKDYANEFYALPAGTEDISLTGKNHYNPSAGNPFYFDDNATEEVLKNRKQGKKKGLTVLVGAVIVGLLVGFLGNSNLLTKNSPKVFRDAGMEITLTKEFRSFDAANYTVGYTTAESAVFALKEEFSLIEGSEAFSPREYGELVLYNNGLDSTAEIKEDQGLTYFEYQVDEYYYFAVIFKGSDAFWLVQFSTDVGKAESYLPDFVQWAKTVKVE